MDGCSGGCRVRLSLESALYKDQAAAPKAMLNKCLIYGNGLRKSLIYKGSVLALSTYSVVALNL